MKAALVVKKEAGKGQVVHLRSGVTLIGRKQGCQVRIPSSAVSRHHCQVQLQSDQIIVKDLNSVNGTFVNGKRIKGLKAVSPGDLLQVGPVVFLVHCPGLPAKTPPHNNQLEDNLDVDPLDEIEAMDEAEAPEESVIALVPEEESPSSKKRASSSDPTVTNLKALSSENKKSKRTTKASPPSKPKIEVEPEEEEEETPDASAILNDGYQSPPNNNDLRSLLSQLDDE
jgi:pSer/pThr/pTyr-binding forkhead associated (FHA) protein